MENVLLILVIALLVAVLVLIGVLAFIGLRFLRLKEAEKKQNQSSPPANEASSSNKALKGHELLKPRQKVSPDVLSALRARQEKEKVGHFCTDHPDVLSQGLCAISGEPYCENCLIKTNEVKLAKKYLDIYLDTTWHEIEMVRNDKMNADVIDRILKVKYDLWKAEQIPVIVQGHYKINIEKDEIESFTVIFARNEDKDFIKNELSFIQE